MNFSMGGKRKKTKGSVFGADKDEEAERKAVQQKRAQELGFSAGARSAAPSARAAASASSSGGTKAKAKKAKDYSDLMKKEPEKIFKEDPAMTEMGLPMAFGKKGVNGHTISLGHPNQQVPGSAAAFKLKQKQEAERAADSAARARVARAAGDEEDEEGAAASRGTRGGAEAARAEDDDDDDSDGDGDDDEDDEDEDDEATDPADDDDPLGIPMKKSISLVHCDEYCIRRVSALSIDPAGSRMITGSYDYHVKFWDFNGMDHRLNAFRDIEPTEGHQVRSLDYSPTGGNILCACYRHQAMVYDRDAKLIFEYAKGDPYIADMTHTSGHVGPINDACWHPNDSSMIMTCAGEGTIRLWDIDIAEKQQEVVKVRNRIGKSGKGINVTSCCFSDDGKKIVGGTECGSIQLWDVNGSKSRPKIRIPKAHDHGEITGLCFGGRDGHTLASRSMDGTLKVWDIRKWRTPLETFKGLDNFISETDVVFSPGGRYILTGTSARRGSGDEGRLLFIDSQTLKVVREISAGADTSVMRVRWHQRLNQIVYTDSRGTAKVFYADGVSRNGALLCAKKMQAKKRGDGFSVPVLNIRNPHALPMFRDKDWKQKRKRGEPYEDPRKKYTPQEAHTGIGGGGVVGSVASAHILQNLKDAAKGINERSMDPREQILRHAKDAEANPEWISTAYTKTQPGGPQLSAKTAEQEEDDSKALYLKMAAESRGR